jgi:thiol-disulfide isomerase/thioredoxin
MGMIENILKKDFVSFTADGCKSCITFEPTFLECVKGKNFSHIHINNPISKMLAEAFEVEAFPTVLMIKNNEVKKIVGNFSKEGFLKRINGGV